jgi:hypothetical protein
VLWEQHQPPLSSQLTVKLLLLMLMMQMQLL